MLTNVIFLVLENFTNSDRTPPYIDTYPQLFPNFGNYGKNALSLSHTLLTDGTMQVMMARRMLACAGPENFSDDFVIGDKLGEGAYAKVFKAISVVRQGSAAPPEEGGGASMSPSPAQYAVKRIARKDLTEEDERSVYDEVGVYVCMRGGVVLGGRSVRSMLLLSLVAVVCLLLSLPLALMISHNFGGPY